ncbi:MAG: glycosyltransferase family A protein [Luteimonas sp.]
MATLPASGVRPDMRHTFVVPAYGQSPHLRACLDSLSRQTQPSAIVIATSTPHDGLASIAQAFGARLAVHAPNAGIGADWNFALAQARTPWVTLAHQDDVYLPTFTHKTLALADAHPSASLVLTGYAELLGDTTRASTPMLRIKRALLELGFLGRDAVARRGAKLRLLRFGCPIPCPSVSLNLAALGRVRFRDDLQVNLDWDAWRQLALRDGAFAYAREPLMLHRIHAASETSAAIAQGVRAAEDRMMFEALWPRPIARLLARAYTLSYETGVE